MVRSLEVTLWLQVHSPSDFSLLLLFVKNITTMYRVLKEGIPAYLPHIEERAEPFTIPVG